MRSALFERVVTLQDRSVGGHVLTGTGLNWRYPIRRRVGGNAGVLPWNVLLCAVVYFVVRKRSVGVPDDCMSVFPCEVWPAG